MIYAYVRVSTDKQTQENQIFEISKYAHRKKIKIDRWVKETISSGKNLEDRKFSKLLKSLKKSDILIVSEISRMGRNMLQIMSILNSCMDKGCEVWSIKENYQLEANIVSKVLAFAFGLSAEIERNLISQRTKEALNRARAEGKKLGRPKNSKNSNTKINQIKDELLSLLNNKTPKTKICQQLGISRSTLYRFIESL